MSAIVGLFTNNENSTVVQLAYARPRLGDYQTKN